MDRRGSRSATAKTSRRRISPPNQQGLRLESLEARLLLASDLVISEVMYHPLSGKVADEWIEIHNPAAQSVSLEGYQLTDGVDFTFGNVSIPAGGFLVVAADRDVFQAQYPNVSHVVGNWVGRLSNGGEEIELEDANGNRVDRVFYADSGDFADRRPGPLDFGARGWLWEATHDGGGHSLELVNFDFDNELAHNWNASRVPGGTPASTNSSADDNIAPAISELAHGPIVPTSSDPVTVTARVTDDRASVAQVSLSYRVSDLDFQPFVSLSMFDDGQHGDGSAGDGLYGVELPPQAHDTVVEFYVSAEDNSGNLRTSPGPTDDAGAQGANALYQVDDTVRESDLPLYRSIMSAPEWQEFSRLNHNSNAQMNATLVSTIGGRTEFRYNVGIRFRGSGSRNLNPTNNRINIPSDRPWLGTTQVNINVNSPQNQIAGSALYALAGLPAADAFAVQLLHNNNDLRRGREYAHVEVINGDWASRQFPLDGGGNAYKGRRANESPPGGRGAGLQYFGEDPGPYVSYLKGTNSSERDWSDVIHLTRVLANEPDDTFLQEVEKVANVDQWLRAFALNSLIGNDENGLFVGDPQGDDYAMYRGVEDPRFQMIPYDLDQLFVARTGSLTRPTGVPALSRLINHPEVFPRFYGQYVDLIENVLTEDRIRQFLSQFLSDVASERSLDNMVRFIDRRAEFVLERIPRELTAESTLPVVGGFPRSDTPGSGALSGNANIITTRSVSVAGQAADWDARRGSWSISDLPLNPGLNRLLVQSFDESGTETARTFIDIVRDTPTQVDVSGSIASDASWTAEEGPYLISGSVTIAPDASLSIGPGTSVFFAEGARLRVRGQLVAEGTDLEPVRFTRSPGSSGTWNGIQFARSDNPNVIRHAILEHGVTTDGMIGLDNSTIEIDHVTFDHTDLRRIRTIDSSLVVRNSNFTTIFEPGQRPTTDNLSEHIWGSGVPSDGEFLLENNFFGHITGHNDGIDFDAPRRPNPIPRIINNIFQGGGDDALDMTGDAYIEGNTFRNYMKDEFNVDPGESNTISSSGGLFTVVRNVFENVHHAALVKEGAFMNFVNNTVVGVERPVVYFDLPGQTDGPGRGAIFDGNILFDSPIAFAQDRESTDLTVSRSFLPVEDVSRGDGNLSGDPWLTARDEGFALRSGSPAIGRGANGLDMGASVPSGASLSGEPNSLTSRTDATLSVGGPGITDYRYRVNDGPWSEVMSLDRVIELTDLPDGTYEVTVIGRNDAGIWQDAEHATRSRTWTVKRDLSQLRINEVLASNVQGYQVNGMAPDAIELFNSGRAAIDLSGMSLSDDPTEPTRFVFPSGTIIQPEQYLVLHASTGDQVPGIRLGFGLSADGEGVYLFDTPARNRDLVDSVEFGIQATDISIGRNREGEWTASSPSLGEPNRPLPLGDVSAVRINEWLADPEVAVNDDFIELYNPNPAPVDLGGMFVTDNPVGWPDQHQLPPLSMVNARSVALFLADGNTDRGDDHLSFGLSRTGESVGLFDRELNIVDQVRFDPLAIDASQGFAEDGGQSISTFALPTPGLSNSDAYPNAQALYEGLRVTELMYNPLGGSDFEFLELQNVGSVPITLNGVTISDAVRFTFPDLTLQPEQNVVVAADTAKFKERYGDELRIAGQYGGSLSNGGETFTLSLPAPHNVDILQFDYDDAWHPSTDGRGFSLVIDDSTGLRDSWRRGESWRPSNFVNGSPGSTDAGLDTGILVINEILANSEAASGDQIELQNGTSGPLNIGGWFLSNDAGTLTKYRIPDGTIVSPEGFVVFNEQDHFGSSFTLTDHGGQVFLASPDAVGDLAGFIESATYGATDSGITIGRHVKTDGVVDFVAMSQGTLGAENSTPLVGSVVLSEVMYHAPNNGLEYIELQNTSDSTVALFDTTRPGNTWRLAGAIDFEFPTGSSIPSQSRLLIVGTEPEDFRAAHGLSDETVILGPYVGDLDDDGDIVQLLRPGEQTAGTIPMILVEQLQYENSLPWPTEAAGVISGLNRLDPLAYANDPGNWQVGLFGGTPGSMNQGPDVSPPSAPAKVSLEAVNGPGIAARWTQAVDDESGVDLYRVYRNGELLGTTTTTEYVDSNIVVGTTTGYAVSAVNNQGLEGDQLPLGAISVLGLESVVSRFDDEVILAFSGRLHPRSVANLENFEVTPGIDIVSARLSEDATVVTLTVSPLQDNTRYNVSVKNMESAFGEKFPPEESGSLEFVRAVPGFSVRGVRPNLQTIRRLSSAERLLDREPDDPRVAETETRIVGSINFLDDDGNQGIGSFDGDQRFLADTFGNDDNLTFEASGIVTIDPGEAGDWTFGVAVATDRDSSVLEPILPFQSEWKYLDDGSNQGFSWIFPDFDDSTWKEGTGEFGYGDDDEATVVSFGDSRTNRHITTYFRTEFEVDDPSAFTHFVGRLIRDDGAVVYINGNEVARDNLDFFTQWDTPAERSISGESESEPVEFTVERDFLNPGRNVLAVEIHQSSPRSDDLSFDLEFNGATPNPLGESGDGFRLRINGEEILNAGGGHSAENRLGTVSLPAGRHDVDFIFYEHEEAAEVELFAAAGRFANLAETDQWRLIGDVASGGLSVVTPPLPPSPIEWQSLEPEGSLAYRFDSHELLSGFGGGVSYTSDSDASHSITIVATPDDFTAALTVTLLGPDGVIASQTATSPGQVVQLGNVTTEVTGSHQIQITSDIPTGAGVTAWADVLAESETGQQASNDTVETAQAIDSGTKTLPNGVSSVTVHGTLDGQLVRQRRSVQFASEEAIQIGFENVLDSSDGASIVLNVLTDLDSRSEFISLDIEDVISTDLFVEGGQEAGKNSATVELTRAELRRVTRDGKIELEIRASDDVRDDFFPGSEIVATLQTGSQRADHYSFQLTGGEVTSLALVAAGEGQADFTLLDPQGNPIAIATQNGSSDIATIRNFSVPEDGRYYVRVTGTPAADYVLTLTRNADVDSIVTSLPSGALDITKYGQVLGSLGSARVDEPADEGNTLVSLPAYMYDGDGSRWDVQWNGSLGPGSWNAFDSGLEMTEFFIDFEQQAVAEENGREILFGPYFTFQDQGVVVHRKVYVPEDQSFVRYLEIVQNTRSTDRSHSIQLTSNLGSDDETTVVATSSGDTNVNVADQWVVTDDAAADTGVAAAVHLFAGPGGDRPSVVTQSGDQFAFGYDLELGGGETQIVMHFALQGHNRGSLQDAARELSLLGNRALAGMTNEEIDQLVNFDSRDLADVFAIQAGSRQQLTVQAEPLKTAVDRDLFVDLTIRDAQGNELATSDDQDRDSGVVARIDYVPRTSDELFVHVSTRSGEGSYLLSIDGAAGFVGEPLHVVTGSPADGVTVGQVPSHVRVDLTSTVNLATVEPRDLTINDQPAVDVIPLDGNSILFGIDPNVDVGEGTYSIRLLANSLENLDGQTNTPYASTFNLDLTGPRIVSTVWNGSALPTSRTFAVKPMEIAFFFDEPLRRTSLDVTDVRLVNTISGETSNPVTIDYNADSDAVIATFGELLEADYRLTLVSGDGAFEDRFGGDLDGEPWGAQRDGTRTGDGHRGGDFVVSFRVDDDPVMVNTNEKVAPLGSRIERANINNVISFAGDIDTYKLPGVSGETLLVQLLPRTTEGIWAVSLFDESGTLVSTNAGNSAGPAIELPLFKSSSTQVYTIRVGGSEVGGEYELLALRGATMETTDSSAVSPLDLDQARSRNDVSRMAVISTADGTSDAPDIDEYTFTVSTNSGEIVDIVLHNDGEVDSTQQRLQLLDATGQNVLATASAMHDATAIENFDLGILGFPISSAGAYRLRVTSPFASAIHAVGHGERGI